MASRSAGLPAAPGGSASSSSGLDGYTPGPVTLTESFGSVLLKAPSPAASNFFGGYALEGRQRERLTQRRGISNPADLYAMLREFGSSIAGAVTVSRPGHGKPDAAALRADQ